MNWGTKVALGLGLFMVFIVTLGILMFNSTKDALVETDYYEKGIQYDAVYRQKEQVKTDHAVPEVKVDAGGLHVFFKTEASGVIDLVRPSDKRMDKEFKLQTDSLYHYFIPSGNLQPGAWTLQIKWTNDNKQYLNETKILVP